VASVSCCILMKSFELTYSIKLDMVLFSWIYYMFYYLRNPLNELDGMFRVRSVGLCSVKPGNRTVQQSCDVIFESQTRLEEKMERNDVLKRGEEK
jgi:hypothetical protein